MPTDHTTGTSAKLVRMANQIASFFETQPGDSAADDTAQHLKDFWDPRMLAQLAGIVAAGGGGLSPIARAAAQKVCAAQLA